MEQFLYNYTSATHTETFFCSVWSVKNIEVDFFFPSFHDFFFVLSDIYWIIMRKLDVVPRIFIRLHYSPACQLFKNTHINTLSLRYIPHPLPLTPHPFHLSYQQLGGGSAEFFFCERKMKIINL